MTTPVLQALTFEPPLQTPAPIGLFAATNWQPAIDGEHRHLLGVEVRPVGNYGGDQSFGIWEADWCAVPGTAEDDPKKEGDRTEGLLPFAPYTVWAYDECDLTEPSRREVEARAAQILRLEEQTAIEREFAERLLDDAGTPESAASFKLAVGYIEGVLAQHNVVGFIHAGAQWASQEFGLVIKSGTKYVSPLGHTWVFGGGYVEGLQNTIVATGPLFGWRDEPTVRPGMREDENTYFAVAERTVVIGYEAVLAAVEIS